MKIENYPDAVANFSPFNFHFSINKDMTDQEKPIIEARVKNALDQIRPYLQQDGGDVEYVDMTNEGVVMVRLKGHCGSCPHALQTLKQGRSLKQHQTK